METVSIIYFYILGLIQGIGEFLPISSSGHLRLFRAVVVKYGGVDPSFLDIPQTFDIYLHLITLIVVVIYFHRSIIDIIASFFAYYFNKHRMSNKEKENLELLKLILISSFFTAGIGLFIKKLDLTPDGNWMFYSFIITGLFILIPSFLFLQRNVCQTPGFKQGVFIGIMQGISVLPGISRSGITITTCLILGIDPKESAKIAYLVSIPAILGAFLLDYIEINGDFSQLFSFVSSSDLIMISIITFISGIISLLLVIKVLQKNKFYVFAIYLICIGFIGLFLLR